MTVLISYLPNLMGHNTQEEAGYEVHQYYALVKVSHWNGMRLNCKYIFHFVGRFNVVHH